MSILLDADIFPIRYVTEHLIILNFQSGVSWLLAELIDFQERDVSKLCACWMSVSETIIL